MEVASAFLNAGALPPTTVSTSSNKIGDTKMTEFDERFDIPMTDEHPLRPIISAPLDGTWILLFGPSGYVSTPLRCEVGHYDREFRPRNPWVNHAGDAFTDGGAPPTYWMPLPSFPTKITT